jgi:hypothetical protein
MKWRISMVTIIIPWVRGSIKMAAQHAVLNAGVDVLLHTEEDRKRIGCPKMVKKMVDETTTDIICFLGDDTVAAHDYMKTALREMRNVFPDGIGLVGFDDGTRRILPTHWVAHRSILDYLGGELFHTGYQHCCCDVELMERCSEIGRYFPSHNAKVYHNHPLINGREWDDDYRHVYSNPVRSADQELLKKRRANRWRS